MITPRVNLKRRLERTVTVALYGAVLGGVLAWWAVTRLLLFAFLLAVGLLCLPFGALVASVTSRPAMPPKPEPLSVNPQSPEFEAMYARMVGAHG
tara:strand:+ start:28 stop:312 length:285 start_codon:yes stop_codon:yes gene_type:complete